MKPFHRRKASKVTFKHHRKTKASDKQEKEFQERQDQRTPRRERKGWQE